MVSFLYIHNEEIYSKRSVFIASLSSGFTNELYCEPFMQIVFFSSLQLCVFLYFLFIFPLYAILWPYNFGKLSFHVKTLAKGKQSKIIKVKLRSHYTFISFIRRNRRAGPNLPFSKTKLKHFKRKHIYYSNYAENTSNPLFTMLLVLI